MECHDARLSLTLQRRDPEQLDAAELEALERHVELCPGCQTWVQSEARFETAVASAMRDVKTPADLRNKIGARIRSQRSHRRTLVAAAAAILLLFGGAGGVWLFRPTPLDLNTMIVQSFDEDGSHPHSIQTYFAELGYSMTPPADFDYDLLAEYKPASLQGRMVPRLTFQTRRGGAAAVAHVYCLSPWQYRAGDTDFTSSGGRQLQVLHGDGSLYLVDCTGGDVLMFRKRY